MARFRLTIEYQGTRYRGWQAQKNAPTVAGSLTDAIRVATGAQSFELYGAGRTDAGVHALAQVAHLQIEADAEPEALRRRINDALPADIHILGLERAPARFHARHHALARSYLYQISRRKTAFGKKLVWWVKEPLDLARMQSAGALLVGMKDWRSFSAGDPEEKSARARIERVELAESGALVLIRIEGSHFLWKMVRRMVGVIVEAGRRKLALDAIQRFLETESDEPARLAAPASGLFLERVYYEGDPRLERLEPVLRVPWREIG